MKILPVFIVIELRKNNKKARDLAKLNTGFSLGGPIILISDRAYNQLGNPSSHGKIKLDLAGIVEREFDYLGISYIKVLEEDRTSNEVQAYLIYTPGKPYSLISDELIDKLEIEILAPGRESGDLKTTLQTK